MQKKYIAICLASFVVALSILIIFKQSYIPFLQGPKVFNIYDAPSAKKELGFPATNPQFIAKIASVKSKSLNQQSISIFTLNKKKTLFQRHFYDDLFFGNTLTYVVSSKSASFIQKGS